MFTYSHANTPLGQSERAYYLSYFINIYIYIYIYIYICKYISSKSFELVDMSVSSEKKSASKLNMKELGDTMPFSKNLECE